MTPAAAVTLIYYLCALPAPDARALVCDPPRMVDAPSCAGAVQRVAEQTPQGSVFLPIGCEPVRRPR